MPWRQVLLLLDGRASRVHCLGLYKGKGKRRDTVDARHTDAQTQPHTHTGRGARGLLGIMELEGFKGKRPKTNSLSLEPSQKTCAIRVVDTPPFVHVGTGSSRGAATTSRRRAQLKRLSTATSQKTKLVHTGSRGDQACLYRKIPIPVRKITLRALPRKQIA